VSLLQDKLIAQAIRDHQTALVDWEYAALAAELHRWVEIFDVEFKLELPSYPVLHFAKLRNTYATYEWFRGEVGTKDNITFNIHELSRDPALILGTLCHELLHLWQHYHGTPPNSNYHNAEFRIKALECGLRADRHGCHNGYTKVFTNVLAKYGLHVEPVTAEIRLYGADKNDQKMKKWRCHCTTVRCATRLQAICLKCEQPFTSELPLNDDTTSHKSRLLFVGIGTYGCNLARRILHALEHVFEHADMFDLIGCIFLYDHDRDNDDRLLPDEQED
jgi:hypothetical protein